MGPGLGRPDGSWNPGKTRARSMLSSNYIRALFETNSETHMASIVPTSDLAKNTCGDVAKKAPQPTSTTSGCRSPTQSTSSENRKASSDQQKQAQGKTNPNPSLQEKRNQISLVHYRVTVFFVKVHTAQTNWSSYKSMTISPTKHGRKVQVVPWARWASQGGTQGVTRFVPTHDG